MTAVIGTLAWEFQVTLPLMASSVFHGWIFRNGAAAYGVMASVMGAGAVVGGLVSAGRSRAAGASASSGPRSLSLAAIGWGIAITAAPPRPQNPRAAPPPRFFRERSQTLYTPPHNNPP